MEKFNYISSNVSAAAASSVASILEENKLNILIIMIHVSILVKVTIHFYTLPIEVLLINLAYGFSLEIKRRKIANPNRCNIKILKRA